MIKTYLNPCGLRRRNIVSSSALLTTIEAADFAKLNFHANQTDTNMNPHKRPFSAKMRVEQAFAYQLNQQPDAPAIIFADQTVSYQGLNLRANVIAGALRQAQIPLGACVGVLVNRSARLPESCLGIYQSGGVYVPLVAELPPQRLAYIIEQAQIDYIIALDGLTLPSSISRNIELIRPENLSTTITAPIDINPPGDSDDVAAILFTSGSTGVPKGVVLSHKAIAHMISGHVQAQQINAKDRILLSASPSYILGFRELHFTFYTGATHVVITRKQLDEPQQVLATMARCGVTVALFTPSYLRLFDGQIPKGLKTLITAGERPNLEDAKHYASHLNYWNCHGATETCGTFSMYQVKGDEQHSLPSGVAFANTQILLLDENGQKVPDAAEGHIYVVSDGLALGYLNNPQLSAQTFVQTPWGRAYSTKELGRINQQGQLYALGRIDDAVKIDGQTVILSEIEQALKKHHQVNHAIALLVEKRLTAVIEIPISPAPSQSFWRGFLANLLPPYMIPAHFACINKVPVNASGKADRMQMTQYAKQDFAKRPQGSLPEGEIEQHLGDSWQQHLKIENIYREDNFFTLGGTSLIAISISTEMTKQGYQLLPHQLLATPILSQLAEKLVASQRLQDTQPKDLEQGLAYQAAEDFYNAWQLEHPQSALVITRMLQITGDIPTVQQLQQAWQHLCKRHASLHTEFYKSAQGELKWRLNHQAQCIFHLDTVDDERSANAKIKQYFAQPIAMEQAPLARAGVVHIQQQQTLLWFVFHHSVIDGISAQLIQNEFFSLLTTKDLPAAAHGPVIINQQESHYLDSLACQQDKQFWQQTFNKVLQQHHGEALSDYAVDKRRQLSPPNRPANPFYQRLSPTQNQTLQQIARQCGIGIHGLLLTLLAHETRRRTAKSAIIIGTAFSHQPATQASIAGMFVNVVPVPLASTHLTSPLSQQFIEVQQTLGLIGEHARYPNSQISADFKQQYDHIRPLNPHLYDLTLTANPTHFNQDDDNNLAFAPWHESQTRRHPAAGIDLAFHHEQLADGTLELGLTWNDDIYHSRTAQQWLQGFADWARYLCQHPQAINQPLPKLFADETQQLQQWQKGPKVAFGDKRIDQQFSQLTEQSPDAIAIIGPHSLITRQDLENHANSIAALFIAQGIGPKDVVAVPAQCNTQLPGIILALFKLGAIYLPLAQDVPEKRQVFMIKDANAKAIISSTDNPMAGQWQTSDVQLVTLPTVLSEHQGPPISMVTELTHPAYIIYTSGTTGKPKGVLCRHESLLNCLTLVKNATDFSHQDAISLVSSPGFDASVLELGLALYFGASLVPIASSLRDDPWAMKQYYKQKGVTTAFHTPSYIRISDDTPFDSLRVLMVGGEAPSHNDVRHLPDNLRFFNVYGPTETTIIVGINELPHNLPAHQPLAVGKTMNNVIISIRDPHGDLVPPGVTGEVWIGGISVSSGYLNRPTLNQKAFVACPDKKHYRSGDLGRWSEDGQLVIAGRIDHQVKLHGQRLELQEIELAINQLPQVDKCAVLVHQGVNQTKTLQAFVRLNPTIKTATIDLWRTSLAEQLPPYMVPANFTVIDAIPVTPSGKLDRQQLLDMVVIQPSDKNAEPPKAGRETTVANVWQQTLNCQVRRTDNFFALGGNSLLAVTIAHQLSEQLNQSIPARALFAAPILKDFAANTANLAPDERQGSHQ
ncbi:MAG: amino acid adenylation domain-containing protein, partial [Alteromonadaceae bacterium]